MIGTICAVFAFRYYHLPISQGAGWAWGPRSRDRSFWAGVGIGSYSNNTLEHSLADQDDLENGNSRAVVADESRAL
jgi:hypothetical protein